ncbi:hypothetical protein AAMO2058_000989800 [Amorphochlora amoebiformis]
MGIRCSPKMVYDYEERSYIEDEDEYDDHSLSMRSDGTEGKITIYRTSKTTHQSARGCCAGGGRADLYITTVVEKHEDGSVTKYKERRFARKRTNGDREVIVKRYKREIDPKGKKTKYVEQPLNASAWPTV